MSNIKDIFGESESDDDEGGGGGDVGALFSLSDDEDEDDKPVAKPKGRLKKGNAKPSKPSGAKPAAKPDAKPAAKPGGATPGGAKPGGAKKDEPDTGDAYDSGDEIVADDEDKNFIDNDDDDQDLLAEYAGEQKFDDRPTDGFDDFEDNEPVRKKDDDENNPMAPTLNAMKRKRAKEMETGDKDKVVMALMQRMADAFNEDQSAAEGKGRLAKVRMLPMLRRIFKQRALHATLLEFDAMTEVSKWLEYDDNTPMPSLEVRTQLLEAIQPLPAQPDHLRRSGIGRIVMKYAREKRETASNKRAARALVEQWSRPIIGKGVDYRGLEAAASESRNVRGALQGVDQAKDDADEIFQNHAAQLEVEGAQPRMRVAVPQFSGFDFVVRPSAAMDATARRGRRSAPQSADSARGRLAKKFRLK